MFDVVIVHTLHLHFPTYKVLTLEPRKLSPGNVSYINNPEEGKYYIYMKVFNVSMPKIVKVVGKLCIQ